MNIHLPNSKISGSGYVAQANIPQPTNPGMTVQATELLRHLSELASNVTVLNEKLTGESQSPVSGIEPGSLAGMICLACEMSASLVGQTSTLLTHF